MDPLKPIEKIKTKYPDGIIDGCSFYCDYNVETLEYVLFVSKDCEYVECRIPECVMHNLIQNDDWDQVSSDLIRQIVMRLKEA